MISPIPALMVFLFLVSSGAFAEPLTLEEVLGIVNEKFPLIEGAKKDLEASRAEVISSEGAFDIQWKTKATYSPLGFYQNEKIDSLLEQPTTLWGTTFFGGYRLGTGKFALYDSKYETNPGGEIRFGLNVPLLRDGPVDRKRANVTRAKLGVDLASLSLEQQRIESLRNASHRYWDWALAGKRVVIFRSLLKIAEERDLGLAERVRHGDLPEFERRDNERAILQRRAQLVSAERSYQQATIELSLYYRDKKGEPFVLPEDRIPTSLPEPIPIELTQESLAEALNRRPDLARFTAMKSQNEVERNLAANQREPKIDFQIEAVRSLRDGDPTRNDPQLEAGVLLEIPLQANLARGREAAATATAARLDVQESFLRDRIHAEIKDAKSALEAALTRFEIIRKEVDLARRMEQGERERFSHGDSTLLFVNLREQATVDAAIRELETLAEYQKGLATLKAALADF
jgi:outer membrane protein TolC